MKLHAAVIAVLVAGCSTQPSDEFTYGGGGAGGGGGDFGATPGGVKNMNLARALVAAGNVPPPDALLVEAMFAEHDLGLTGSPCPRTLCLRAAAGYAPEIDGTPRGWAQLGLSSTIDPTTWTRPSTTFVFVVDVSGSMGWGQTDDVHPPASQLARKTLHALVDQLRPDDRVALVTFSSAAETVVPVVGGDQQAMLHTAIDALVTGGSTDVEVGMQRGYQLGAAAVGTTQQVREIVFTDTQPNVGATQPGQFANIVAMAETEHVETSVLCFGTGIGAGVMRGMASLRGANAYGMTRLDEVDDFMANDYPWFTTPVAYDLEVDANVSSGWTIERGLGFPAATDSATQLQASTVFLSARKGAMLLALADPATTPDGLSGGLHLHYTEPSGTAVTDQAPFGYDGGALDAQGDWFAQRGVARTTALGLYTEAMHLAATQYTTDPMSAVATMNAAQDRFTTDAAALGDPDLPAEVDFGAALLHLLQIGAPQGTLYGPH
jgi:Ca-activated chloride channel family protein